MTAEQIMAIKALADILNHMGAMPIAAVLGLLLFGPWVVMFIISQQQARRFEAVAEMYESSVTLVRDHQELVERYKAIVEGQQDLIIHTTQVLSAIKHFSENNLFCPMVRKGTQGKEVHG